MNLTRYASLLLLSLVIGALNLTFGQTPANPPANPPANTSSSAPANATTTPSPLPVIESMQPTEVARGGAVVFHGQNLPTKLDEITVYLNGQKVDKGVRAASKDQTSFVFAVPTDIALGRYNVRVDLKIDQQEVPFSPTIPNSAGTPNDGMLTIFSETGKTPLKITAVYPLVSYPESDKEVYGFDVIGEGFSSRPSDNGLRINQTEIPVCWPDDKDCAADETKARGAVMSTQQLHFEWKVPKKYLGGAQLQIRVGDSYSAPFDVTLSRVASRFPKIVSIVAVIVLFGLVLWLLSGGFRNVIAGRKYSILSALFLDSETDTYSLSRFQFFVWTSVALLTYLYLLISRSLVQGRLEFVDVPGGLPGIILVSAGTTVLAQAITKSKGPKGAGEVHPSLADLVSTGGVIVPERFQFFIWTILGAAAFVFLTFLNDPGSIKDLPSVPAGFLQLMGVSSAGYLGGKLARRAGPVIDEIVAKIGSLEFTLKGRNLSKDASFRIGDKDITSDNIEGLQPEILEVDTEGEPNTGKLIRLKIKTPETDWLKDNASLTITNPDGQKASWTYTVGPIVNLPIEVTPQEANLVLTIKGVNLSAQSTVALQAPDGTPWPNPVQTEFQTPDTLTVTTQGQRPGIVVITNADQRTITANF